MLATKRRLDLLDPIEIHDCRAARPEKLRAVEPRLERTHRLADHIRAPATVNPNTVVRRFDPVDLLDTKQRHSATCLHHEPRQGPACSAKRCLIRREVALASS